MAAALVTGCATDSSVTTTPTQVKCQVTLATEIGAMSADGGAGTLTVTTTPECPWDVSTSTAWLSNLTPASGQGTGTVAFRAAANPLPAAREGDIAVNDSHVRVAQQPAPCRFTVSPATIAMDAAGGAASVSVSSMSGCSWSVTTDVPWIAFTSAATGSGDGVVQIAVAANASTAPRSATISLGSERVSVTQAGRSPDPGPCTIAISPSSQSFPAAGGTAGIAVAAGDGCPWSAASTVPWVTVTGGGNGSGNGGVAIAVATNAGAARTGTAIVAGQTYTVTQAAAPVSCVYRVTSTSASFPDSGGNGSIAVGTSAECAWTAASDVAWIAVTTGASGSGTGTVAFTVAANGGAARTGTVTVAGQTITVTQAAAPVPCTFTVAPATASIGDAGGTGSVTVTATAASCAWTAASGAPWLSITSGPGGTGSGSVSWTAAANTGAARSGTLTIAGQTVTVTQAAAPPPVCTFTLNPGTTSIPFLGGTGTVAVTTAATCAWTASSSVPWLTITGGAAGTGPGTVGFLVLPNIGAARTGTLSIGGQTFTVTQAALVPQCSYSISPSSATITGSSGSGTLDVTTTSACAWTAVANDNWIVITSGASGTGNGTVAFRVMNKPGKNTRTGTITVAGRTFTVTHKG